jgi:LysM repeat protein
MTFAEKQQMIGKTVTVNLVATSLQPGPDGEYITYTVRYGDTIWDIVKKYDNVTTNDVLVLNNISDPSKIKVGQILKIKKKS